MPENNINRFQIMAYTPDAEKLIELAARNCYQSFDKMDDESYNRLIPQLIKMGHFSVLEHASATVRISGSRSMTHQLVRHRLASYSQESQRFVNYADRPGKKKTKRFIYELPVSIDTHDDESLCEEYKRLSTQCYDLYEKMLDAGIRTEDARYILPNSSWSDIYMTANLREWRHIFKLRCQPKASWEIRGIMIELLKEFKQLFPNVFIDFIIADDGMSAKIERDSIE